MTQEQYNTIIEKLDKISGNQVILDANNLIRHKELLKAIKSAKNEMIYDIDEISTDVDKIKKRSS